MCSRCQGHPQELPAAAVEAAGERWRQRSQAHPRMHPLSLASSTNPRSWARAAGSSRPSSLAAPRQGVSVSSARADTCKGQSQSIAYNTDPPCRHTTGTHPRLCHPSRQSGGLGRNKRQWSEGGQPPTWVQQPGHHAPLPPRILQPHQLLGMQGPCHRTQGRPRGPHDQLHLQPRLVAAGRPEAPQLRAQLLNPGLPGPRGQQPAPAAQPAQALRGGRGRGGGSKEGAFGRWRSARGWEAGRPQEGHSRAGQMQEGRQVGSPARSIRQCSRGAPPQAWGPRPPSGPAPSPGMPREPRAPAQPPGHLPTVPGLPRC